MRKRRFAAVLGFTGSVAARVCAVAVYAALAFGAVAWVEGAKVEQGTVPSTAATTPTTDGVSVRIEIDATFSAASWRIESGGREIVALESTSGRWIGEIAWVKGTQQELVVEATGGDAFADHDQALRIRLLAKGQPERETTSWGRGDLVATVALDRTLAP